LDQRAVDLVEVHVDRDILAVLLDGDRFLAERPDDEDIRHDAPSAICPEKSDASRKVPLRISRSPDHA
jgi:hypothetical protein